MPKQKKPTRSRKRVGRKMPKKKRRAKGGSVKASDVLGGISAVATGASALGFDAPITLPIAGITGLASGVLKLFGKGGLTQAQMNALMRAERQGVVLAKHPGNARKLRGAGIVRKPRRPGAHPIGTRPLRPGGPLVRVGVQPARRNVLSQSDPFRQSSQIRIN